MKTSRIGWLPRILCWLPATNGLLRKRQIHGTDDTVRVLEAFRSRRVIFGLSQCEVEFIRRGKRRVLERRRIRFQPLYTLKCAGTDHGTRFFRGTVAGTQFG